MVKSKFSTWMVFLSLLLLLDSIHYSYSQSNNDYNPNIGWNIRCGGGPIPSGSWPHNWGPNGGGLGLGWGGPGGENNGGQYGFGWAREINPVPLFDGPGGGIVYGYPMPVFGKGGGGGGVVTINHVPPFGRGNGVVISNNPMPQFGQGGGGGDGGVNSNPTPQFDGGNGGGNRNGDSRDNKSPANVGKGGRAAKVGKGGRVNLDEKFEFGNRFRPLGYQQPNDGQ